MQGEGNSIVCGTVTSLYPEGLRGGLPFYVAALPAYHSPLGGQSVGIHPLVTLFLPAVR